MQSFELVYSTHKLVACAGQHIRSLAVFVLEPGADVRAWEIDGLQGLGIPLGL